MCYLNIPNCGLVKAETIDGRQVADKWQNTLSQLESQYKAAKKILEQKRSTLLGTLFGDDCGAANEPSMFDVPIRTEDRYKALQPYLDAVTALVLDALVVLLGSRLPELLRDVLLLIAVFATSLALCTVLRERATLAGYVWFSDLESNNPVAVSAMNLAVAAICAFLGALVCTIVAGFRKVRKA